MVGGIGFLTTSAISGFLVAWGGMAGTLIFAIGLSLVVIAHLLFVQVDEPRDAEDHAEPRRLDLAGTFRIVLAIPGLFALILFSRSATRRVGKECVSTCRS